MAAMRDVIASVRALVEQAGYPTAFGDATGLDRWPYVLVWASPGQQDGEPALSGAGGFEDLLGVTMVDTTATNVLAMAPVVRAALDRAVLATDGFHAVLRLARGYGQPVQVDRSATLTDSNSHPSFAVDRYRLTAQPTE